MTARRAAVLAAALVALTMALPAAAGAHAPATYGSGHFGTWGVDEFGLPFYRYTLDEAADPRARQPELGGATRAQHQLGNDHIVAAAFNDGYTQLWSQDRLSQWANRYQPASRHYGGGYGYLNVAGRVASTLYLDRPAGHAFERDFGAGYYRRRTSFAGIAVQEVTYAPFGDDPLLLDDVTLTNTTRRALRASWFEYWDVNPYDQLLGSQGNEPLRRPTWDARTRTLTVAQAPANDGRPLAIFAAALSGPLRGFDSSTAAFFGSGTRAAPAAIAADRLSGSIAAAAPAGAPGTTLVAFRAPLTLAPGRSITLRYAYGIAHLERVRRLVARYRAARSPFAASERAWAAWIPRADFGSRWRWVARELAWDAYLLRSATVYEEACGHHTITQGGYYQYDTGANLGYRSWLHYLLPMVYADPALAREILRYSSSLQPQSLAIQLPYGTEQLCRRFDLGTSSDLDFWLLQAAAEYGLGARDTAFFDERLPFYASPQRASAWDHIKLAFRHQESLLGPHGGYEIGSTGDWSDFSTQFVGLTESMLVTAQLAYAYPRLAELAELRHDGAFAAQLRAAGARDLATLRGQWTGGGWYARGYAGARQVGQGVIFGEPQPWAILAGAPSARQAQVLVGNIRRFLDGVGAPAVTRGPARIGSAITPARADPGVTERGPSAVPGSTRLSAAEYPGGVWFDVNGWLTWALGQLDGVVPGARQLAWSEYTRNTLATHATVFPHHWAGTISIDDVCNAFYADDPARCGNGLTTAYDGQITEQPAWMVMDAIRLAGVTPLQDGYEIVPHLPMPVFSLRLAQIGVSSAARELRGYVRPQSSGLLRMRVALPAGGRGRRVVVLANGRRAAHALSGGLVTFALPTRAERRADWAVLG